MSTLPLMSGAFAGSDEMAGARAARLQDPLPSWFPSRISCFGGRADLAENVDQNANMQTLQRGGLWMFLM